MKDISINSLKIIEHVISEMKIQIELHTQSTKIIQYRVEILWLSHIHLLMQYLDEYFIHTTRNNS